MRRVNTLDIVRGILMLYIVFIVHGLFWLDITPPKPSSWLLFEMPCIFMISGYAYALYERAQVARQIDLIKPANYFKFLASRCARILIPYAIYAAACVLIMLLAGSANDHAGALIWAWMNPATHGRNYAIGVLGSHLWFVPPFLAVTAAMPLATKIRPFKNPIFLLLLAGFAVVEIMLDHAHFPGENVIKQVFFYLLFSLLGYYMANFNAYFKKVNFVGAMLVSIVFLALSLFAARESASINMQTNKFPPNGIFFAFSCIWVSLFLMITFKTERIKGWINASGDQFWLKPFISAGYSIYLWQGIGYTAAMQAGQTLKWPVGIVWVLALLLSVALGLMAAPAEKVKLRFLNAA